MAGKVKTYGNSDIKSGVIQNNFLIFPNFVSFKGSSNQGSGYENESVVTSLSGVWKSDDEINSNFTVSFKYHLLKLTGISMMSCTRIDCTYKMQVLGSYDSVHWQQACQISKSKTYFKTNISYAECASPKFYKHYRLMQDGMNANDNNHFPIYFLEMFGNLLLPMRETNLIKHVIKFKKFVIVLILCS